MDKEIIIVSLNKDKIVVAENLTTYKREDIGAFIDAEMFQISTDTKRKEEIDALIENARGEQEIIKQKIEEENYRLNLYMALQEQFNTNYPLTPEKEETALKSEINESQEGDSKEA